jgi:hypothetical protein
LRAKTALRTAAAGRAAKRCVCYKEDVKLTASKGAEIDAKGHCVVVPGHHNEVLISADGKKIKMQIIRATRVVPALADAQSTDAPGVVTKNPSFAKGLVCASGRNIRIVLQPLGPGGEILETLPDAPYLVLMDGKETKERTFEAKQDVNITLAVRHRKRETCLLRVLERPGGGKSGDGLTVYLLAGGKGRVVPLRGSGRFRIEDGDAEVVDGGVLFKPGAKASNRTVTVTDLVHGEKMGTFKVVTQSVATVAFGDPGMVFAGSEAVLPVSLATSSGDALDPSLWEGVHFSLPSGVSIDLQHHTLTVPGNLHQVKIKADGVAATAKVRRVAVVLPAFSDAAAGEAKGGSSIIGRTPRYASALSCPVGREITVNVLGQDASGAVLYTASSEAYTLRVNGEETAALSFKVLEDVDVTLEVPRRPPVTVHITALRPARVYLTDLVANVTNDGADLYVLEGGEEVFAPLKDGSGEFKVSGAGARVEDGKIVISSGKRRFVKVVDLVLGTVTTFRVIPQKVAKIEVIPPAWALANHSAECQVRVSEANGRPLFPGLWKRAKFIVVQGSELDVDRRVVIAAPSTDVVKVASGGVAGNVTLRRVAAVVPCLTDAAGDAADVNIVGKEVRPFTRKATGLAGRSIKVHPRALNAKGEDLGEYTGDGLKILIDGNEAEPAFTLTSPVSVTIVVEGLPSVSVAVESQEGPRLARSKVEIEMGPGPWRVPIFRGSGNYSVKPMDATIEGGMVLVRPGSKPGVKDVGVFDGGFGVEMGLSVVTLRRVYPDYAPGFVTEIAEDGGRRRKPPLLQEIQAMFGRAGFAFFETISWQGPAATLKVRVPDAIGPIIRLWFVTPDSDGAAKGVRVTCPGHEDEPIFGEVRRGGRTTMWVRDRGWGSKRYTIKVTERWGGNSGPGFTQVGVTYDYW